MDFSLLFDPEYLPLILATLVGFGLLAAALLVPVWRFLDREQKVAEKWTPETLAKRMRKQESADTNGTHNDTDSSDASTADRASDSGS